MFYTVPEAELPIPQGIAPHGERAWHWLELGLQMPYFFSTVRVLADNDESFFRHLWFSQIDPILDIKRQAGRHLQLTRLDIFTPAYVNGTDGYRLDQLRQVWRGKSCTAMKFQLADGTIIFYDLSGDEVKDSDMALILTV